ncbi:MAG: type III restriction protein res subunit [Ignavibacteria bacterium]|nr:MAG: type III restriction protein res subunit [Ignavibacteria bacterium]KAF0158579.1 MAG: type III restriction protein res subunit [Ignavibacteria bacterium]
MPSLILEEIITSRKIEDLPLSWSNFNFSSFSASKTLYDYQIKSLQNTAKLLHLYYEEAKDFSLSENPANNLIRKEHLLNLFNTNEFKEESFSITPANKDLFSIFSNNYPVENDQILFRNFINRCSFWMATGSGKSLLIIKVIELLSSLITFDEIPAHDILILAPREDLLDQIKELINEYNAASSNRRINLYSIKDYERIKNEKLSFSDEISVFYYRSVNFSDEQKEVQIDYRNYDNNGNWYILLDEAHKGGKEDSKRQSYFSILSRNGFLFNFSATFTDNWDLVTTLFNFNLEKFITEGYGKHLYVSGEEYKSFNSKNEDDFSQEEKEKIVIKSLLTLSFSKDYYKKVHRKDKSSYHSPLMLTLVNSVNTEESDLLVFFNVLVKFARGRITKSVFNQAKDELIKEFKNHKEYIFENEPHTFPLTFFSTVEREDVLKSIFNSDGFGEIEVTTNSTTNELAFKLKESDKPFALINIGDISEWIKNKLIGYEFTKTYDDKSYFNRLNENPHLNIMMGSRRFYEGWDSNRPNVINYINIGTSTDAQKFILQSLGRGVRISPLPGKRKRIIKLRNSNQILQSDFEKLSEYSNVLETLFIFGTNKSAIQKVVEAIKSDSVTAIDHAILSLTQNESKCDLFIPYYDIKSSHFEDLTPFYLAAASKTKLNNYLSSVNDNVLLFNTNANVNDLSLLRSSISSTTLLAEDDSKKYSDTNSIINRFSFHINSKRKYLSGFKNLDEEIIHFKKISISNEFTKLSELINTIKEITSSQAQINPADFKKSEELFKQGIISEVIFNTIKEKAEPKREALVEELTIKRISEHYYIPVITSDEKVKFIKHIIQHPSEVAFLNELDTYVVANAYDIKKKYDWWMFSKINESLDSIYIPYMEADKEKSFFPDFIFWLKKGNDYKIIFVDPKGTAYTDYQLKVDGFEKIFSKKSYEHLGYNINVSLKLFTDNVTALPRRYREFWFNNPKDLL